MSMAGKKRDFKGKFKATNERCDKKISRVAVRKYDPARKRSAKPVNVLSRPSSFTIEVKREDMLSAVNEIKKSLRNQSYDADRDTGMFSTPTKKTLRNVVEKMYSVCLGSKRRVKRAIEVTDRYCTLVGERRVGISGGGRTTTGFTRQHWHPAGTCFVTLHGKKKWTFWDRQQADGEAVEFEVVAEQPSDNAMTCYYFPGEMVHEVSSDKGSIGLAAYLLTPGRTVIDAVVSLWFCKNDKNRGNAETLTSSRVSGIEDELAMFYEKYRKGPERTVRHIPSE